MSRAGTRLQGRCDLRVLVCCGSLLGSAAFGGSLAADRGRLAVRDHNRGSVIVANDRSLPQSIDDAARASRRLHFAQTEDSHSAHHPGNSSNDTPASGGQSPAPSSNSPGSGMMGDMMGRPRKELYPTLMDMPTLSMEQRRNLDSQARGRINSEVDGISAAEMDLRHAIAAGDVVAADRASGRLRDSINQVQSGVTVLRSLNEGKSPQQIAQTWFKAQMNLSPQPAALDADGVLGISWFHVITMGLLATFSAGLLAIYVARMRRANALVDRLTRGPAPTPATPPGAAPPPPPPPPATKDFRPAALRPAASTGAAAATQTIVGTPSEQGPRSRLAKPGEPWKGKLRVAAIYKETPGVKTFRLQDVDGGMVPFGFLPGQFLTYSAEIDGRTVKRSYTIASSAAQTAYVETTIKREDDGVFSDHMHDSVKEGDLLDVMAPSGAFTFTGVEADSVVLIGGGVGITPLMAAIRYLWDIAWPGQIYLIYGAQSTEQFIFRDELEYLQRRMNNLHVAASMARAAGTSWMGSEGQITADFLTRAVPELTKRRVHLCGPPGMMETIRKTLVGLRVPPEQIKTEAFGPARGAVPPPATRATQRQAADNGASQDDIAVIGPAAASIRFATSGKVAPLPPDKSVLEVAESVDVPIDYSCRAGICGVCKTHLLEGSVTMEVQDALTEDDKAKGIILACQAKSIGHLVVEA